MFRPPHQRGHQPDRSARGTLQLSSVRLQRSSGHLQLLQNQRGRAAEVAKAAAVGACRHPRRRPKSARATLSTGAVAVGGRVTRSRTATRQVTSPGTVSRKRRNPHPRMRMRMMMRLRIRMRMADEDFLVLRWSRMRMRMTSMWTWNTAVLHMCYHRQRSLPVRSGWRQGRVRRGRPLLSRPRGAVDSGLAAVLAAVESVAVFVRPCGFVSLGLGGWL